MYEAGTLGQYRSGKISVIARRAFIGLSVGSAHFTISEGQSWRANRTGVSMTMEIKHGLNAVCRTFDDL
jgi:hypothetical protein